MHGKQHKHDKIVNQFRDWYDQHGSCVWSVGQVAEATGISEVELYEPENFTGLLMDLSDSGVLCRSGDHFALASPWSTF